MVTTAESKLSKQAYFANAGDLTTVSNKEVSCRKHIARQHFA